MKGHEFAYNHESCGKTRISQHHPAREEAVAKERGKGRVSQESAKVIEILNFVFRTTNLMQKSVVTSKIPKELKKMRDERY